MLLTDTYLDILNQGDDLPEKVNAWFTAQSGELPIQESLGLYLVTLACEQLDWRLSTAESVDWQHGFRLFFKNSHT